MVNQSRVQGAFDMAKGAVKKVLDKLTGDEKLKAEGIADKTKGHAESAAGGARDIIRDKSGKL
jgi:uncharacterized protein YjbJ (UPF0337 family)